MRSIGVPTGADRDPRGNDFLLFKATCCRAFGGGSILPLIDQHRVSRRDQVRKTKVSTAAIASWEFD